jgi:hypothetical protein
MTVTSPRTGASLIALALALLLVIGSRPKVWSYESGILEGPSVQLDGRRARAQQTLRIALDSSCEVFWGYGYLSVDTRIAPPSDTGDTGDTGGEGREVAPNPRCRCSWWTTAVG